MSHDGRSGINMIYLDYNATGPILPQVIEAMEPWLEKEWGNPSSIYASGRLARRAVNEARGRVAALVGAHVDQIVFTSGATEANNAAIHSALRQEPKKQHVVTSAVEHSAVLAYCQHLEKYEGVSVTYLPVDEAGCPSVNDLRDAIREDTVIVSLMWANNETGVISPAHDYAEICQKKGVRLHTDAVQAVGKLPVDFHESGASYLSLSGHKFGASKGAGALVIRDPDSFVPLLVGGKQENGHRGGTENVAFTVGLGVAAEMVEKRGFGCWKRVEELRNIFERDVLRLIDSAKVNGGSSERLQNTSNIYLPGIDADALVTYLDQQGICVSSGSACLESAITPSHVIFAMTQSYERASESLRVSLGLDTTEAEMQRLVSAIEAFVALSL
jgi:cysteine desulfurase